MGVIVQLGRSEHLRIESDRADFTIGTCGGKDTGTCVVGGVGFNDEGRVGLIMGKDGSCREGYFEGVCHGSTGSPSALLGGSKRGRDGSRGAGILARGTGSCT